MIGSHVVKQSLLVLGDLVNGDILEVVVDNCVDNDDLVLYRQRRGLGLLQHGNDTFALCETGFRVRVEVGAELRERL